MAEGYHEPRVENDLSGTQFCSLRTESDLDGAPSCAEAHQPATTDESVHGIDADRDGELEADRQDGLPVDQDVDTGVLGERDVVGGEQHSLLERAMVGGL